MNNKTKLVISVAIDIIGFASYIIPIFGDISDILWGPIEAAWIWYAYRSPALAIFGGIEELLPFTDFIPMCTIAHFVTKKDISKNK
jgi:hypothetical protein